MTQLQRTVLDSGLTILQIPMPSVKSATVLAFSNTGSRYETPEQYGIAHFFEHMVFKGTQQYPTAQDLALAVDSIGADFNAFTSKEYTGYYVHAAADHLSTALSVVSDMLLTPQLRQEDIDREKGVIIEEINMYVDSPARHIANKFDQMVFSGTSLEHDILGLKETVQNMTTDHFRSFLKTWYGLSNLVVVLAGDASVIGKPETLAQVEAAFAADKITDADRLQKRDFDAQRSTELTAVVSDQKLHVEHRKTEQAHFVLGWPAIKRKDPRKYALGLLNTIMGGNMSSRLFTEVREKRGLCYYVNSSVDQYHDLGLFGASAGVDPKRVKEAIEVTIDQFTQASNGQRPITEAELSVAKEYIAGKLVLGLEDSQSVAHFYGIRELLLREQEDPQAVLDAYRAVTLEEVQAVATEIIKPDQLRFAIIGPYEAADFAWLGE